MVGVFRVRDLSLVHAKRPSNPHPNVQNGPISLTMSCVAPDGLKRSPSVLHLRCEIWSCFESTKCGHSCRICDYPDLRVQSSAFALVVTVNPLALGCHCIC